MRFSSSIIALAATAALALPSAASAAPYPVHVAQCSPARQHRVVTQGYSIGYYPVGRYFWSDMYGRRYYQAPYVGDPTLSIDYSNATEQTMKEIEFGLVISGDLVAEVRDSGTFSPGVSIKHEFGLSPNIFPLRSSIVHCVPLRITYANGNEWKNPHLPALKRGR